MEDWNARIVCVRVVEAGREPGWLADFGALETGNFIVRLTSSYFSRGNQYLSVPPEIAKTLDPAVAELLGYSLSNYTLGKNKLSERFFLYLKHFELTLLPFLNVGYASPPRLSDLPPPDLIKTHEAAPLGSDTVAPEIFLGRAPRDWATSAGVRKGSSLTEGKTVVAIFEETEGGDKKLKETRPGRESGEARL